MIQKTIKIDSMDKQQLKEYIYNRWEALKFWESLIEVVPWYENLRRIKSELAEAERQLKILGGQKVEIKLNKLSIKNFKGIKAFALVIMGANALIYGDNAAGKTTLFDSFKWLLFGKDSSDRSKFKIKPQDADGNEVHYLQTEVEAELNVDGKPLKLRKMLEENWTTKRGETEKKLTGNTISYWWDDEPINETEYLKRIDGLVNEKVFKIVTDPLYFLAALDWKERRKVLINEMCGDVPENEILVNEKFSKLSEILSGKTIEVYKKILAEKISLLEKQRKDIPPRIDELARTMPELKDDYTAVELEIERLKAILVDIDGKITSANNNAGEFRKKQQNLLKLQSDLQALKTKMDNEANSGTRKIIDEKAKLENEKYRLESEITTLKSRLGNGDGAIAAKNKQKADLLEVYKSLNIDLSYFKNTQFDEPEDGTDFYCSTCNQPLPLETKEEKIREMRLSFENHKNLKVADFELKITENINSGKLLKTEIETLQAAVNQIKEKLVKAETNLKSIELQISDMVIPEGTATVNYGFNPEYKTMFNSINVLTKELETPLEDSISDLLQSKREIQNKIDNCNTIVGSKTVAETSQKRINELKDEEKRLATEITSLKGQEFLIQEFDIAKINSLEDKINSHFKFVKFRMFENQVNGGIAECCEALVNTNGNWVPYSTNSNFAGTINAGLDCINALSDFYKIQAPVFVDNIESVSECIKTNSQVISLIKPETFVKLDKVLQDALISKNGDFEMAKRVWNDRNKTLRVEVEK